MFEILRDPIWQFIAVILALAAILISIFLYQKQRRRKALSYEIISRTPLLSMEEEVKGKLQILFDKKPVQQVHLIVVRIVNSGNLPILSPDYERPIGFSFGEKGKILTTEVVETYPSSLRASVRIEGEKVVLDSALLNQGDSIKLKILVSQFDGQIAVDGRIVGVKDIQESSEKSAQFLITIATGICLTAVGTIGVVQIPMEEPLWWIFVLLLSSGYLLYVIPVARRLYRVRRKLLKFFEVERAGDR